VFVPNNTNEVGRHSAGFKQFMHTNHILFNNSDPGFYLPDQANGIITQSFILKVHGCISLLQSCVKHTHADSVYHGTFCNKTVTGNKQINTIIQTSTSPPTAKKTRNVMISWPGSIHLKNPATIRIAA